MKPWGMNTPLWSPKILNFSCPAAENSCWVIFIKSLNSSYQHLHDTRKGLLLKHTQSLIVSTYPLRRKSKRLAAAWNIKKKWIFVLIVCLRQCLTQPRLTSNSNLQYTQIWPWTFNVIASPCRYWDSRCALGCLVCVVLSTEFRVPDKSGQPFCLSTELHPHNVFCF